MLHAYENPPTFRDGDFSDPRLGILLSEGDLDVLTHNTIVLDALSYRASDVTSSSAGTDTGTPNHYSPNIATEIIYRGSFLMESGMTAFTIEGWAQKGASEDFQYFLNGAGVGTVAVPNGAAFSFSSSVTGVTVGTVGEVVVQRSGALTAPQALVAKYVIYDAYVSPAPSIPAAWSGTPTFAGTYSAALLNQLGNAQGYVAARLNAIPYQPFIAAYYTHGSSVTGDVYPLWWGGVERANGSNILNIRIAPVFIQNIAEVYKVTVNGSVVHTSSTYTAGQTDDDYLAIDLSAHAAGVRLEARIETFITTGAALGPSGDRNSKYHLWAVRMSNSAPATAAAPTDFTAAELIASTTVDTRLDALSTIVAAAKARIDANPRIFNRVPLMRRTFGRNAEQWETYTKWNTYTQRFSRKGARLVVRGKGVRVGWGNITTKSGKEITTGYSVEFAHSEQLTDGDSYQTKIVPLDSLPYLRRGQAYSVYAPGGDLVFAAEYGI